MQPRLVRIVLAAIAVATAFTIPSAGSSTRTLSLDKLESEPATGRAKPSDAALASLQTAVLANVDDRKARFELVRGLMAAQRLPDALKAAKAWREHDAYNLVVVRLIGDIYSEMGERDRALRTYSAVVELLPKDAAAQRALASVLKQSGDIAAARDRLAAAVKLRPDDLRLRFELADAEQRLGETDRARSELESIAADPSAPDAVRYPAKQRLAQIWNAERRTATASGDVARASEIGVAIERLELAGGTENDIKIYLTWDTDRSDVDLWVTNPAGDKIWYQAKQGKFGDALYNDVTTGYGPESFTAPSARPGTYLVQVNYYHAAGGNFAEARGEVAVILGEGTTHETKHVLPYRLFEDGQTVTVARIEVK